MHAQIATFTPKSDSPKSDGIKEFTAKLKNVKTGAAGLKHLFVLRNTGRNTAIVIGLFDDKNSLDKFAETSEIKKLLGSAKDLAHGDVELYEAFAEVV
jgi:hypothetical protein